MVPTSPFITGTDFVSIPTRDLAAAVAHAPSTGPSATSPSSRPATSL